jgi:outer membrane protein assembly factor BamB
VSVGSRRAKIERAPRAVKPAAACALAWAVAAACGASVRPAPVDPAALWPGPASADGASRALPAVPREPPIVAWEAAAGPGLRGGPALSAEAVVVASTDRNLRALSLPTGEEYWARGVGARPTAPIVVGARIYVGTDDGDDGEVRAVRFRDGGTEWKRRVGPVPTPLAFRDGTLYGVAAGGVAFALDAGEGRERWRTSLTTRRGRAWGPLVSGDRVYVATSADSLYALDRATGRVLHRTGLPAHAVEMPALAGDAVVVPLARGILAAYDTGDLRPRWQTGGFDAWAGGVAVAGDEVYAVTRTGRVVGVRTTDGRHRILAELGEPVGAGPTAVEGGLLVGTLYGTLRLLDVEGQTVWTHRVEGSVVYPPVVADGTIAVPAYGPTSGFLGTRTLRGKVVLLR